MTVLYTSSGLHCTIELLFYIASFSFLCIELVNTVVISIRSVCDAQDPRTLDVHMLMLTHYFYNFDVF
jgi:hypothetical protein